MKITKLQIDSFRGIKNLELHFETDSPTVLIGTNGSGKSSILECLSILLSWFTARIQNPQSSGRSFQETDIKNYEVRTQNTITVDFCNSQGVEWSVFGVKKEYSRVLYIDDSFVVDVELKQIIDKIHSSVKGENLSLPVVVYYPTNRAVLDISLKMENKPYLAQIETDEEDLTGGKIDFRRFFEWFQHRGDLENERKFNHDQSYRDPQLKAVRKSYEVFFMNEFSNLRVQDSPLRMTLDKNGKELIINQLSDGEKCLLAVVGDLARRLAIANPNLSEPLEGEGVILIDEIELHLHPKWQQKIIPALTQTFPNCQFIVTTHSPLVISHVDWVHLLCVTPNDIIVERLRSYGKDSNRILETLMDSSERPVEIQQDFLKLFRLIDSDQLEEAKRSLQQLRDKLGEEDPKFVRADGLIRRKEILKS
ncbi:MULTISPECIES: AAA family ATPase [Planktothrix]|jgi:predicted ATP-binding protein involved in virulence|uniref:SMC domain protein n=2 Tax=Planktothrix TaxID=54304 RepID=A0A4P6A0P5_PLAAG|nr:MULTISPECIES: AAA family ATPase [Planktothrix]CAD5953959.1 ATP binding protein [Planktothrix rubescens]CAC5344152.1 SMC domain protein [Planktothrix rubescens NIVA-CYA 18]CAD5912660.1 ATP binding protein [Planktothrix rubescens NIVA-CYA 18]CAH2570704.1 ATP binding protein [Planktothrix rubescens]GDZ94577.1 SMC domain protein [Planktothrix agardhii CCAP 1459/11A]